VANRLPVHRADESEPWRTSPGGVVRALSAALAKRAGIWIGWTGSADDAPEPFSHEGIYLHPVAVSADEIERFYDGFSNATLWPLFHDAIRPPVIEPEWWEAYVDVNERFAEATVAAAPEGALVWVHDYQLMLVPEMVRARRPDLVVGFFLHIPFPPHELFERLPWREELLHGVLGADLVGLQRQGGVDNLRMLAERLLDATSTERGIVVGDRVVAVEAHPVSIDTSEFERLADRAGIHRELAALRVRLGDPDVVFLGVDRLDYTKGIADRLRAFRDLLEEGRLDPDECAFVQVAVPTRERIDRYAETREEVERLVGEINGRFGRIGSPVVHYLYRSLDPADLALLYRAADVMLVTPLRDGMNLVAKEYVTCRVDGSGVLVLSEFVGAADAFPDAVLVNPHDPAALANSMLTAATLERAEARRRMAAMRAAMARRDVHRWVDEFLTSLVAAGG
jgi:trehalose 6-phosphate synthase